MAGKTLDISEVLTPDNMGTAIANMFVEWDMLRRPRKTAWEEIQRYIYSTDTTTTTNAKLQWKNKTTLPKLCQIRDNLYANYIASLFPKSEFIEWEGRERKEQTKKKTEIMEAFGSYAIGQSRNKEVLQKLVLDYIDYGNCFAYVDWEDDTVVTKDAGEKTGYIGPVIQRISPYDIVFNPIAPNFASTPKIIRSIVTIGELRASIDQQTKADNYPEMLKAFDYLKELRFTVSQAPKDFQERDALYRVDGFTSFQQYLKSSYVELLTFHGDFYDVQADKMYKDCVITIADRHCVLSVKDNPSAVAKPRIRHIGWRPRQDNIWAMGPLENLVGMQYRIDHVENLKADVFDLISAPPLMIKGLVEDFDWAPFARIYVGDDGDVKVLAPEGQVLSANLEIDQLQQKMEEYAGSPKEAAGFRTPGEKTAFEVQRLENAASRIFYSKTKQFEEFIIEPCLNDMLEITKRRATGKMVFRVFEDQTNATKFLEITPEDLSGFGKLRPIAARNFAEKAERIQNLNNFFGSVIGQDQDIKAHFSTIGLARMFEELLDIEDYAVVQPYVRLFEQQQAQSLANAGQEQIAVEAGTPVGGLNPDDTTGPAPSGLQ